MDFGKDRHQTKGHFYYVLNLVYLFLFFPLTDCFVLLLFQNVLSN